MHATKHAVFAAGLVSTVYGIWLIWHPAAWIAGGALLVGLSFLLDRASRR